MRSASLLAVVLGVVPLGALSQESRDASETGLPSMTADRPHGHIGAHNQAAGEADRLGDGAMPERTYGAELMTEVERSDYRGRMQNATTAAERERLRAAHDELMEARARERGVVLPEYPRSHDQRVAPGTDVTANPVEGGPR